MFVCRPRNHVSGSTLQDYNHPFTLTFLYLTQFCHFENNTIDNAFVSPSISPTPAPLSTHSMLSYPPKTTNPQQSRSVSYPTSVVKYHGSSSSTLVSPTPTLIPSHLIVKHHLSASSSPLPLSSNMPTMGGKVNQMLKEKNGPDSSGREERVSRKDDELHLAVGRSTQREERNSLLNVIAAVSVTNSGYLNFDSCNIVDNSALKDDESGLLHVVVACS